MIWSLFYLLNLEIMTVWVFIGRLNPPHIWHTNIIKRALKENKKLILMLWVPLIVDDINPLTTEDNSITDFKKRVMIIDYLQLSIVTKLYEAYEGLVEETDQSITNEEVKN